MANRYPLVIDTTDANKIKELQTGDNLNLADNSIVGVQNITALGTIEAAVITVQGNRLVAQNFLQLSDTPNTFTGNANKFAAVNAAGTALEFRPLSDFGTVAITNLDITGNITPTIDNTSLLGSSTNKFNSIWATNVYANLRDYNNTLIFNATTGKIAYSALQGAPTNVSEFVNDVGFATTAGINQYINDYFSGATGNTLKSDLTGSVFADDSTVMIDAVAGKIVGNIHYPTVGTITAGTKIQLGTTELTSTFTPPTNNTGEIGTSALRFGQGYFQNINASGNITASTFNGTLNGILIGDQIGSVFGDDSTLLVDAVSGTHFGPLVGDVTGSIFADDSGVLVDAINSKIVGAIDTTNLRTSESAIALGKNAGKTSHGTRAIAIGEDAGETSQGGNAIGIGTDAGKSAQGSASIAIGASAGLSNLGPNAIAIGASAGTTNQAQNSIILNATGGVVENTVNASFVVKPIRAQSNANYLKYNVLTGEITYEADAAGVFTGDLTGSVFADDSTLLVDGVNARHNFPNNVLGDLGNVSSTAPTAGQVLKWDGSQWAPGTDATTGGAGTDADTLDGFDSPYFLAWANMTGTPTTLAGYGITDAITTLVADTTPQLGGNLDVNGNDILLLNSRIKYNAAGGSFLDFTVTNYSVNNNTVLSSVGSINMFLDSASADASGDTAFRIFDTTDPDGTFNENTNIFKIADNGDVTLTGKISLPDGGVSSNYAGFGADEDLKIFHNGSHSIVRETGTGSLYLQSDNNVILSKDTDTEIMVKGIADGAVELYHNAIKKFETTTGGVSIVDEAHIEGATPHLTLKRTNNANVPSLRFQGQAGVEGANISFDGTAGTTNELIFQTYNGSTLGERFRVKTDGVNVTGPLNGHTIPGGAGTFALTSDIPAAYTNASVDAHLNQSNPTSGYVLSWNGSDYAWIAQSGGGSLGSITFTGSTMDTNDSSGITVTPAMVLSSDLTVQNDLVVNNTITANKFVSSAVGSPKITSTTNIELNAQGAVIIGSSQLRIKSFTTAERDALTASTGDIIYNTTLSKLQLRIGSNWKSISISDDIPTNNNQLTNGAGYITSATDIHTFNITNNGASDYVFAQDSRYFPLGAENDPVLYVRRGETYHFVVNASGHPFQIRTSNGGSAYNTGVTNNGTQSGTIVWTVPMTAPNSVYYQCTAHSGMGNTINIVT